MDWESAGKDILKILVGAAGLWLAFDIIFPMTGREMSTGGDLYGEIAVILSACTIASYVILRMIRKRKIA